MGKNISHQKGRQNPLSYLFRKTWVYSEGNRRNLVLLWTMFIIACAISLFVTPFLWARIMNAVSQQGVTKQNISHLIILLAAVFGINLLFWMLHGPARVMEQANAFKARVNYRRQLLRGVMGLPMEWHVDHHSGDTINKISTGTISLYDFSKNSYQIVYACIQLIGSYVVLVYFSPLSGIIVLVMIMLTVWITMRFDAVVLDQYKTLNRAENAISESVYDAISNITTVIVLRVERLVFKAIMKKVEKPYGLFRKNRIVSEWKWFLTSVCCTLMIMLVLCVYFWQHVGAPKGILVGSVYLLINYLTQIGDLFFKFTGMYGEILDQKSKVMNSEELSDDFIPQNFTNHLLPPDWRRLDVASLSFSYHNSDGGLHLDDISMSIARGERIALVGETGSGKTTFLKVIRDLYHPRKLELAVDGKPIVNGFEGISQAISLVPQNPEIFATTILDNITLGADHDIAFVKRFADMACFSRVADRLPHKFETSIKEKGVNLSGGQQQRLALARGLLACHDKDIVLLDEPTSSLDTATEMAVYQNIFKSFKDKTIISTIHRMHLLPFFHRIYFFSEGRIIGSGTLQELLLSHEQFQQLWQKSLVRSE